MGDVVDSKNWCQVFGNSVVKDKNSDDKHFLKILSEEYKAYKDKQVTKQITRMQRNKRKNFWLVTLSPKVGWPWKARFLTMWSPALMQPGKLAKYAIMVTRSGGCCPSWQQIFLIAPFSNYLVVHQTQSLLPEFIVFCLDVGEFLPQNLNSLDNALALRSLRNSLNFFIGTTFAEFLHVRVYWLSLTFS